MRDFKTLYAVTTAMILLTGVSSSPAQSLNALSSLSGSAQTEEDQRIELIKRKAKLRQKCRGLSSQLVPKLSNAEFMRNSPAQNEAVVKRRGQAFLQCLKLSNLEKNYSPDLVTLQNALPGYRQKQRAGHTASDKLAKKQTALTLTVKQDTNTTNSDEKAVIRILNIKPAYQAKMLVKPGLYHVRITKKGFKKWDQWLKVKGKHFRYRVNLKPIVATISTPEASTIETSAKTATGFTYPARRKNPLARLQSPSESKAENTLDQKSRLAALQRAKRAASIKAQVAAKKARQQNNDHMALIPKQKPLIPASLQKTTQDGGPSPEDEKFQAQVNKNKAKLERGLRILAAQRRLNGQRPESKP